ncbi:hypothetical protein QJR60_09950 [Paraclostridium sordellii]|uniref:hypothetical protein n=1 Tax=Paraclostridium sordellii TaxID=1505 RepID=UPI0030D0A5B9
MKKDQSLEYWIGMGAELVGGGIGGAVGFALGGPAGAILGGPTGTLISKSLGAVGLEMKSRMLSNRESIRIGAALSYFVNKVNENIEKGKVVRDDSFFENSISNKSDAEEIYEGLLIAAQKEHEEKKIKYMGNLLGNIVFRTDIDKSFANLLIKEASNLSYRQMCLIKLFYENNNKELKRSNYRQERIAEAKIPVLYEIIDLDKRQLINNSIHHVMGLTDIIPDEYLPNGIGVLLYDLFELNTMTQEEITSIKELLS